MALLTVQKKDLDGLVASYVAAAAGGDTFANDGNTSLHIVNASGGIITVTVTAIGKCNQGSLHDSVTAVPAGGEAFIGDFDKYQFNDSTGIVSVGYSGVTTLTVAAIN